MASGGASKYLTNLPSRSLFSPSTIPCSNPGGIRVYVCDRETLPPDEQIIKTNPTNILIRSLKLKKQKIESIQKDARGKSTPDSAKGKRAADKPADGKFQAKRANTTPNSRSSRQEGSSSRTPEKDFQGLTVEKLRINLKERGLSTKGKKDELIARLRCDKVDRET